MVDRAGAGEAAVVVERQAGLISPSPLVRPVAIRILGIDPGSQRTGVGIIDVDASGHLTHVFHTALAVAGEASFPLRLKRIFDELCAIIGERAPERRWTPTSRASICAAVSRGLEVHEYAATEVKQAVVGGGHGDKSQVQHMVGVLLGLSGPLQADAADALAIAITHAHTRASLARVGIPRTAWRRRR